MAKKSTYISHDTRVKEIIKLIEDIGKEFKLQEDLIYYLDDYFIIIKDKANSCEKITKEIEKMKKRAKALKKQEQKLDTEEQQPIVSQTTSKVQPTNMDDFSDEELDKFIEEMDAKQKEKEQRIERLKKIKRAKELIALSKQQDREISELESQIQKEGMDFNE